MRRGSIDEAAAGRGVAALAAGALLALLLVPVAATKGNATAAGPVGASWAAACGPGADTVSASTTPPDFYAIELVPTGNVTGTGSFVGRAEVRLDDSPFDVAVSEDGTFRRQVRIDMRGLRPPPGGDYVVWATPPTLDPIVKLGALGEDMTLSGQVAFPKFLLVVSLEERPQEVEGKWKGPIVHRGMSRSGFMHTMAGHGPFSGEPCSSYGFRP